MVGITRSAEANLFLWEFHRLTAYSVYSRIGMLDD